MQSSMTSTHPFGVPFATIIEGRIVDPPGSTVRIPVDMIRPFKRNPRKNFRKQPLDDLTHSFGKKPGSTTDNRDVEQAIHVTLEEGGVYAKIVNGERRWRGSAAAKLTHLSCYIRAPMTEGERLLSAFRQNLFQDPMNPMEEANGYKDLMEEFGWGIEELAKNIGKKVDAIKRVMKYLDLNPKLQEDLLYGRIEKGVALVIAGYKDWTHQDHLLGKLATVIADRDGRPIHPNEAIRICRKEAELRGFPQPNSKRGRKYSSHAQLSARNLRTRLKQLDKALAELGELDETALKELRAPTFLEVEADLSTLRKKIDSALTHLSCLE